MAQRGRLNGGLEAQRRACMASLPAPGRPAAGLVDLDVPPVAECCCDLCDLDIVCEIETVGARVVGVERSVPDDQYGAPGRDGVQQRLHRMIVRGAFQGGVVQGHELVARRVHGCRRDVRTDPLHVNAREGSGCRGAVESNLGHVDASHLPATCRQPDRIRSLAASLVERAARRTTCHFRNQHPVSPPAPQRVILGVVPRIPLVRAHGLTVPAQALRPSSPTPAGGTAPRSSPQVGGPAGVRRFRGRPRRRQRRLRRAGGWWGRRGPGCPCRRSAVRSRCSRGRHLQRLPGPGT